MIVGIGDSNLEFGGHGWAHAFSRHIEWKSLIFYPGGNSREVLKRLKHMTVTEADVPEGAKVLVTLGINDTLDGIPWYEFCQNHIKIKDTLEAMIGPRDWVWMPGHWQYPNSPISKKMEAPFFLPFFHGHRAALRYKAKRKGIEFWNLAKHKDRTFYRAINDPFHLKRSSYEVLADRVMADADNA